MLEDDFAEALSMKARANFLNTILHRIYEKAGSCDDIRFACSVGIEMSESLINELDYSEGALKGGRSVD